VITKRRRTAIFGGGAIIALLLVIAFFTNPDQAAHLKAIRETIALRNPESPSSVITSPLMGALQYNNYFIFSTTNLNGFSTTTPTGTMTYGYFGQVKTTNAIGIFYGVTP
jgi:hypothetical protein